MNEPSSVTLGKLKAALETGGYTCVLWANGELLFSRERGVKPLLCWIREGKDLRGALAADKVVGKAAALLYAYMGASAVYAGVAGEAAAAVLARHSVFAEIGRTVPRIRNRAGTGFCPMETAVWDVEDPAEAFALLQQKVYGAQ